MPEQALALMAAFQDEWPCLIIVPPALRGTTSYPITSTGALTSHEALQKGLCSSTFHTACLCMSVASQAPCKAPIF